MKNSRIPDVVVRRLPLYLRAVSDFARRDHTVISSHELGEYTGLTPAQVRKDLTFFGEFGKQGIGYDVKFLQQQLRDILRLSEEVHIGLVGFGNLGHALVHYNVEQHSDAALEAGIQQDGMRVTAIFDVDPTKVNTVYAGIPIYGVSELREKVREYGLKIAVLAVPAEHAQTAADECVAAGIKALLNFAPVKLTVPPDVKVHSADLTLELQSLAFYTE